MLEERRFHNLCSKFLIFFFPFFFSGITYLHSYCERLKYIWILLFDRYIRSVFMLTKKLTNSTEKRFFFEKLILLQLVKKFAAFYRTRMFVTVCTKARKFVPILSQINPAQALVNNFYFIFWTVTTVV